MEIETVERCLHERVQLAFAAAQAAGLPGRFTAFERDGLCASLASDQDLAFLNRVNGVSPATIDGLVDVLATWDRMAASAPILTTGLSDRVVDDRLRELGFAPAGRRPIAVLALAAGLETPQSRGDEELTVCEARYPDERQTFLDVLAAGYESSAHVADFMKAEHSVDEVRQFVAWLDGEAVGAAAMSRHRDIMVLGGAAVLSSARGSGIQQRLLRHRLDAARAIGCDAAVATAAPESPSLRNLDRAGFLITYRPQWRRMPAARS